MSEEHNVSHYYQLQSENRQAGQPVYNFTVTPPNFGNASSFELATVQIPITYYAFNSNTNTLGFTVNGGPTVVATIPIGNYDQYTILTALSVAMAAVAGGPTYVVTISPTTGKMTITQNAGVFVILGGYAIHDLLGFVGPTASAISATGTNIINLAGTTYIDIYSIELTKFGSKFSDSASSGSSRILRIPVSDYTWGATATYRPAYRLFNTHPEANNPIDIQIRDMYGRFVDFNGRNMWMKFKYHSDKPHRNEIRAGNQRDFYSASVLSSKN